MDALFTRNGKTTFFPFFPKSFILSDVEGCHKAEKKKISKTVTRWCPRSVDTTHRTHDDDVIVNDLCDDVIVIRSKTILALT